MAPTARCIEKLPLISLTMTYRHARRDNGGIVRRKDRCSIRGFLMRPQVHYGPNNTAAYDVEKTTTRSIYAPAARSGFPLRYLDISSDFTTELYRQDRSVYVKQLPQFDATMTHPTSPICSLSLSLSLKESGTEPVCNIYHEGLDNHLQSNGFTPSPAAPCIYSKSDETDTTFARVCQLTT